jgi:electron transfer flavoprotein beta subunit
MRRRSFARRFSRSNASAALPGPKHRFQEALVKIVVCVKQVPSRDAPLAIAGDGAWIRETDIGFEMNEPDGYALEEALRLKEKHGGEVVVVSLGPERAKQTIKEALAKGADRAIHVVDAAFYTLDPLAAARSLAAVLQKESPDLVLTGLQSDDHGFGQTGVLLAELLELPHATIIMQIEALDGKLKLKRELEAGWFQWLELPLPAVLSVQSGINKPRYATLKGIMAAKKKEIQSVDRATLGVVSEPTQTIERIYVPQKTKKTEFLAGSAKEAAAALLEKLRHEARVLS